MEVWKQKQTTKNVKEKKDRQSLSNPMDFKCFTRFGRHHIHQSQYKQKLANMFFFSFIYFSS